MVVLFGHGSVEVQIKCIQNMNPKAYFFRAIEQGFNNCYIDARYQDTYEHSGLYKIGLSYTIDDNMAVFRNISRHSAKCHKSPPHILPGLKRTIALRYAYS